MVGKGKVPDAWEDDDWEVQADRAAQDDTRTAPEPSPEPQTQGPVPKKERFARHAEAQRKLWEAAEAPEETNFMAASSAVPLATPFKPALKVLSRKPAPTVIAKKDPVTGLQQLTLQDEEEDEDEDAKKSQVTVEEIRQRQQRELEEKQRRYDEARAKIFGDSNPSSGQSSPGSVTPPNEGRSSHRGRGRGRGGGGGYRNDSRNDSRNGNRQGNQGSRPGNSQQPGRRELFDPEYSTKSGATTPKRGEGTAQSTPREENQIIRAPRGPNADGRGGFGFARRGTRGG